MFVVETKVTCKNSETELHLRAAHNADRINCHNIAYVCV